MAIGEFNLDEWTGYGTQLHQMAGGDAHISAYPPTYEQIPHYYMGEGGAPKFTLEGGYSPEYAQFLTDYYANEWSSAANIYGFDPETTDEYTIPKTADTEERTIRRHIYQDNPNARSQFFEGEISKHIEGAPQDFWKFQTGINEVLQDLGKNINMLPGNIFDMYKLYTEEIVPTFPHLGRGYYAEEGELGTPSQGLYRWAYGDKTGRDYPKHINPRQEWVKKYLQDQMNIAMNPEQSIIDELNQLDEVDF
tara:strand:+ start:457 stop:1206 length:750 start_codon:yes stop_codon:yes gene_type:complete